MPLGKRSRELNCFVDPELRGLMRFAHKDRLVNLVGFKAGYHSLKWTSMGQFVFLPK